MSAEGKSNNAASQTHETETRVLRSGLTLTMSKQPLNKSIDIVQNKNRRRKPLKNEKPKTEGIPQNLDLRSSIAFHLEKNLYECSICYDVIRPRDKIWSCEKCYSLLHYKCCLNWARKSAEGMEVISWRCPSCQNLTMNLPSDATCFCGKNIHQLNRFTPHSCGNTCGKKLKCSHTCLLNCHPGPCMTCETQSRYMKCACQKYVIQVRCLQLLDDTFVPSCNEECRKLLNCGIHECTSICHTGPCFKCQEMIIIQCFCSKKSKTVSCGTKITGFSCLDTCGFKYECGIHICTNICHEEKHINRLCSLDPKLIQKCCCGSKSIEELGLVRKSCTNPLITCGNVCNKILPCGHMCEQLCHESICGPCPKTASHSCRCGRSVVEIKCVDFVNEPPKCREKCGKKKSCNRHTCQDFCCPYSYHECEKLCGKTLSCTKHSCMQACGHLGKCHVCVEGVSFEERICDCGRTVELPPIQCNAPLPRCVGSCNRIKACGHPTISMHPCHPSGTPCPPCPVFVSRSW